MNAYIFLNDTKYPVFVDFMAANFESNCQATIEAPQAVNGWIAESNGVEYATSATYIDHNGKLKLKCRMTDGEEGNSHTSTVDIFKA